MDNYQNIYQKNENSIDDSKAVNNIQLQFKPDDFYNYVAAGNDDFQYILAMHKSARLLIFAKVAENIPESQMRRHCIWVDANSNGRYLNSDQDEAAEPKLIPTEFVREKYRQVMYYSRLLEDINNNELSATKPGSAEEQKLQDLKSVMDLHLIRLVKLLIHDLANIEHIPEITDNKLNHAICNIVDNNNDNNKFIPDLMKDENQWLRLKLDSNSYYLDETDGLQEDNNAVYYIICHKTHKHIIFMKAPYQEFKSKAIAMNHLYISDDDGLGRYKVQIKAGDILKQFFIPAHYVMDCYNKFIGLFNDFKKLQDTSDVVYTRQTRWCKLQDDAIYLINHILGELDGNLKQEIDTSLNHHVMSLASPIGNPNSFDDFYNKVVEREKMIRLQNRENIHSSSLIIHNRRNRTTFIIHISNFASDIFYVDEKMRIYISKYDPDYYVMVSEAWIPKNHETQQHMSSNYHYGDVIKLPNHEKAEVLTFIGKTKNSGNRRPDKSEMFEIIKDQTMKGLEF
jgi:hypothetical protein